MPKAQKQKQKTQGGTREAPSLGAMKKTTVRTLRGKILGSGSPITGTLAGNTKAVHTEPDKSANSRAHRMVKHRRHQSSASIRKEKKREGKKRKTGIEKNPMPAKVMGNRGGILFDIIYLLMTGPSEFFKIAREGDCRAGKGRVHFGQKGGSRKCCFGPVVLPYAGGGRKGGNIKN